MAAFEKKIKVQPENQLITVSASVDFQEAEEALNAHNLTLMVRPSNKYGAIAGFLSVGEPFKGGLGLNAFSFGHIRNSVESVRVITSSGKERLVSKDHDDFPYFLGTNGRYGIITEVTLKALPKPEKHFTFALHFLNAENAFRFLQNLQSDLELGSIKCRPMHVEFFGRTYLDELNRIKGADGHSNKEKLISPESIKENTPAEDIVLFVFYQKEAWQEFADYVNTRNGFGLVPQKTADELWDERFSPMKLRKKGDLLTAEVILPLEKTARYLNEITHLAAHLGIKILPVAYLLNSNEVLLLPQFLTDRRHPFQYYRHFSLVPVLARRATKRHRGRPYGYGIWFAGLLRKALGNDIFQDLKLTKKRLDPKGIFNPGKLSEIRSRLWNQLGKILLHERGIDLLDLALRFQARVTQAPKFREIFLSTKLKPYKRQRGDALHRCVKCSACMICPLAQIWEKSGDPTLMKDAIYITPRFKMEYMQQHLFEGKKITQEDVDRFVLCFRCGVAERELVCPISDLLLQVEKGEATPCQKKLPTYDDFEERLRQEGYDVDGAIQRYMEILKTHPGVARAMQEVLGKYRVPKTGDLVVLQPKTDFAIYKVEVDQDRCINCGKCGDEHTASERGFWDVRNPRKMVSLDDLLRELDGKIPKSWFRDQGGPIPTALKNQGKTNGEYIYFPEPSLLDAGHHHCNGCLYCVIECPVDAIRVKINDYYVGLAGKDFSREDVRRINEEARTGDVPTSGTGSTGLFGGQGFDRYMFDFSVIVRPTRDGIREAIDIGVNLGRKPLFHVFENNGEDRYPRIKSHFHTLDLPTPMLLELPKIEGRRGVGDLVEIFARCAHREGTLLFLNLFQFMENFETIKCFSKNIGLRLLPEEVETVKTWMKKVETDPGFKQAVRQIPLVELVHENSLNSENGLLRNQKKMREIFGGNIVISNLVVCPLNADSQKNR
jgi:glycolate oxidase